MRSLTTSSHIRCGAVAKSSTRIYVKTTKGRTTNKIFDVVWYGFAVDKIPSKSGLDWSFVAYRNMMSPMFHPPNTTPVAIQMPIATTRYAGSGIMLVARPPAHVPPNRVTDHMIDESWIQGRTLNGWWMDAACYGSVNEQRHLARTCCKRLEVNQIRLFDCTDWYPVGGSSILEWSDGSILKRADCSLRFRYFIPGSWLEGLEKPDSYREPMNDCVNFSGLILGFNESLLVSTGNTSKMMVAIRRFEHRDPVVHDPNHLMATCFNFFLWWNHPSEPLS